MLKKTLKWLLHHRDIQYSKYIQLASSIDFDNQTISELSSICGTYKGVPFRGEVIGIYSEKHDHSISTMLIKTSDQYAYIPMNDFTQIT